MCKTYVKILNLKDDKKHKIEIRFFLVSIYLIITCSFRSKHVRSPSK
jgi:hypothetical protein